MEQKRMNKQTMVLAIVFVAFIAVAAILYGIFKLEAVRGEKKIVVTVVDDQGERVSYKLATDAEYLRGALEEIKDLSIEGPEEVYGLYVKTVNGVYADYDETGAYWAFYVNGEYCNYSIEEQPVYDGDEFEIRYEAGF